MSHNDESKSEDQKMKNKPENESFSRIEYDLLKMEYNVLNQEVRDRLKLRTQYEALAFTIFSGLVGLSFHIGTSISSILILIIAHIVILFMFLMIIGLTERVVKIQAYLASRADMAGLTLNLPLEYELTRGYGTGWWYSAVMSVPSKSSGGLFSLRRENISTHIWLFVILSFLLWICTLRDVFLYGCTASTVEVVFLGVFSTCLFLSSILIASKYHSVVAGPYRQYLLLAYGIILSTMREEYSFYESFFRKLIESLREHNLLKNSWMLKSSVRRGWFFWRSGVPGVFYGVFFESVSPVPSVMKINVGLYIDRGKKDVNKKLLKEIRGLAEDKGVSSDMVFDEMNPRFLGVFRPITCRICMAYYSREICLADMLGDEDRIDELVEWAVKKISVLRSVLERYKLEVSRK